MDMRFVVIYKDEEGTTHRRHVDADSQPAAYAIAEAEYDSHHGQGSFKKLSVGVGTAAEQTN
jgi:hypothetical protein